MSASRNRINQIAIYALPAFIVSSLWTVAEFRADLSCAKEFSPPSAMTVEMIRRATMASNLDDDTVDSYDDFLNSAAAAAALF